MTTATEKKITLATVKSFIRKSGSSLLVSVRSRFDGMVDGCRDTADERDFTPALESENPHKNNMGIQGIWFVFGSRDWCEAYDDGTYAGYSVSNCCGKFILAVKK